MVSSAMEEDMVGWIARTREKKERDGPRRFLTTFFAALLLPLDSEVTG